MLAQQSVMLQLSWHPVGCWLVQWVLEEIEDPWMLTQVAACLGGSVVEAAKSPYANYVLQKVIQLNLDSAPFVLECIIEELTDKACSLACDPKACRIFCRLVEQMKHASRRQCTVRLIDALLKQVDKLILSKFGHHFVEKILQHGLPDHRVAIATAICKDISKYAYSTHGRWVLVNVLTRAPVLPKHRMAVARHLLALGEVAKISADIPWQRAVCAAQRLG